MAISGGVGAIDGEDSERPCLESSRRLNNTFGPADITGTITDTIAVGVGGATVLLDETSVVGALLETIEEAAKAGQERETERERERERLCG